MRTFDVIVIGAGASGLIAAKELSASGKSVCVIEARDRIGGRIHTITDERFSYPVETGAEFIHGKLEHSFQLIREAGLDYYRIKGNVYQVKNGVWDKQNDFIECAGELMNELKTLREDMSVKAFLAKHFPGRENRSFRESVTRYAEGYDASDASRFSALAFKFEMENEDEENYRVAKGYTSLVQYLWNECEAKGCVLRLNNTVKQVNWQRQPVKITTGESVAYMAKQVIVTIPLGVWQARSTAKAAIDFIPALKEKQQAARKSGFGGVIKIILQFDELVWKDVAKKIGFIITDRQIPTWWTQEPDKHAMLSGWVAGPAAAKMKMLRDDEIINKALASLASAFKMKLSVLRKKLVASHVFNWLNDPFARGAYGYEVTGGHQYRRILAAPVKDILFFAGEAVYQGSEMGTVEAALASGKLAAQQLLARSKA